MHILGLCPDAPLHIDILDVLMMSGQDLFFCIKSFLLFRKRKSKTPEPKIMEKNEMKHNLKLVGENKGFKVYFNSDDQMYTVFKDGKVVLNNKYKFTDIKSYLD